MKTIKQFDRATCTIIHNAIDKALEPVAKKFGISIDNGSGSYTDDNYTLKIELAVIGEDGTANSKLVTDFKHMCSRYNLQIDDLGKQFKVSSGVTYEVKGLSRRSHKFPIIVKNIDNNKMYKLTIQSVQRGLGRPVTETYYLDN